MNIPKEHQTVMPYLMLQDATHFIDFTKEVFNATLAPGMPKYHKDGKSLMHCEINIGGCTIMFTDATEQWQPQKRKFICVRRKCR